MSGSAFLFIWATLLQCLALAQVIPGEYRIGLGIQLESSLECVNGSLSDGRCKETTASTSNCDILFDGLVPNLTPSDFQGDMWARELLTINNGFVRVITTLNLIFNSTVALEMVEIVMFNCPQWEIGMNSARIAGVPLHPLIRPPTSCDSLVSLCLPVAEFTLRTRLTVEFNLGQSSRWIHLAEVKIRERGSNFSCPSRTSGAVETPASPTLETTTITSESTGGGTTVSTGDNSSISGLATILASVISASVTIIVFITAFSVLLVIIYKCRLQSRQRRVQNAANNTGCLGDFQEAEIDDEVEHDSCTNTEYCGVRSIGLVKNPAYSPHYDQLQQLSPHSIELVSNQS